MATVGPSVSETESTESYESDTDSIEEVEEIEDSIQLTQEEMEAMELEYERNRDARIDMEYDFNLYLHGHSVDSVDTFDMTDNDRLSNPLIAALFDEEDS